MGNTYAHYIPALRYDWLTPLYDPIVGWMMREAAFKCRLVEQARIESGHHVLDLGCGTATLTILVKQAHPDAEVSWTRRGSANSGHRTSENCEGGIGHRLRSRHGL